MAETAHSSIDLSHRCKYPRLSSKLRSERPHASQMRKDLL
nr:MAG TPA: hypothetical protein [Herelleviridae sp.]